MRGVEFAGLPTQINNEEIKAVTIADFHYMIIKPYRFQSLYYCKID